MRPIDADALKPDYIIPSSSTNTLCTRLVSLQQILIAPTIDAVPVVRCKDCIHWGMHKRLNVPWCFEMHIDKSEEGYCDSGERRENE